MAIRVCGPVVAVVASMLAFNHFYPDASLGVVLAILIAVSAVAGFTEGLWYRMFLGMAANDAVVFATVVKKFYEEDPILTNAVWNKAVPPYVIPPWRQGTGEGEEQDG